MRFDIMKSKQEVRRTRECIRHNIHTAYSLHDMRISGVEVRENELTLRLENGMIRVGSPCCQVDGYVKFEGVQWDFCYVWLMEHMGNNGKFSGEKMFLREFIDRYPGVGVTVMDETYGYNMTKYNGYFLDGEHFYDCILEICHEGDMAFVEETEFTGMAEVILSHDGEALLCQVPAEVAAYLDSYCLDFSANWVWHGPENGRFFHGIDEYAVGAVFGTAEFIDYLNRWAFPGENSEIVRGLGCSYDEIPAEYADYPRFNF